MQLTVKRKAFLEEIPRVVEELIKEYGSLLKTIEIKEDEKGCYTIWATYERPTS